MVGQLVQPIRPFSEGEQWPQAPSGTAAAMSSATTIRIFIDVPLAVSRESDDASSTCAVTPAASPCALFQSDVPDTIETSIDFSGEICGLLAERGANSLGLCSYRVKMRSLITSHDGSPVSGGQRSGLSAY